MRALSYGRAMAASALLFAPQAARAKALQLSRPPGLVVHHAPGGGSDLPARFGANLIEKAERLPARVVLQDTGLAVHR